MLDVLSGFVAALREAGLPVSLTEAIDAAEAVSQIPIEDRALFKAVLGATLVKSHAYWEPFDVVFETYFALRGREFAIGPALAGGDEGDGAPDGVGAADDEGGQPAGGGSSDTVSAEELAAMLYRALVAGDAALVSSLARAAVTLFAGMEAGRPVGGTYYLFRTLRQLDLDRLAARMMAAAREEAGHELTALEERLAADEHRSRLDGLRREVEAEIRRRLVGDRGAAAVARTLRKPLPEDVDFMHASREELAALRRAIYPLTRKLAARLARRRQHGMRGPLDFRATVRHSLSYGGVPAEPRFRRPTPSKPEIMVVADISGSVAAFARFTLQLVYAISSQFARVRSFVFVDGIDEVTPLFEGADDLGEALASVNANADVVWVDGHSNYGHAFEVFWDSWSAEVNARTTVLILGDARNNYHSSAAWVLAELRRQAKHVWWLNPEPRSYWDTGDSIASEYAQHCDGAYECRNLRQLEHFVEQLA
ncbi:MAG: vWA domain-containing protein [Acidimicrobiales bacterium]